MAHSRHRRVDRDLKEARERKYRLRGGSSRTGKFIPAPDSDFALMARVFANHIQQEAQRFAIPPEQVGMLNAAVEQFRAALSMTMRHGSAGPKATSLKNEAREHAEKIVRAVARSLRAIDESLTSVDRMLLNLHQRPARPKVRAVPQIAPVLRYVEATKTGRHVLEYANDFDYSSNAKPHGAARLELFCGLVPVGGPVPTHPGQLSGWYLWYLRSYTTSRFEAEYFILNNDTTMLVVYWGRWADVRGGVGPFSQTCVARVEGGRHALSEPIYIGRSPRQLAIVSRKVQPREFPLLEAAQHQMLLEATGAMRQLECAPA